ILEEDVVARPAVQDVLPRAANEHVVAGPAAQGVVAGAADQHVAAVAAVGAELDGVGGKARGFHHIVAGAGGDVQPVGGFGPGDVHLGEEAGDGDPAGVAGDVHHVIARGAV